MNTSGINLSVKLGKLSLKNPLTVASGTFGSGREYDALWRNSGYPAGLSLLGALTTKGVSFEPWTGNPGTRIAETTSGMLNSVGLQNKGVEAFIADDLAWLAAREAEVLPPAQLPVAALPPVQLPAAALPVIVNVCGHSTEEYLKVIERLEYQANIAAYELNISCPNVSLGGSSFGTDPQIAAKLTAAARALTARPLIVKLTPNVTDITEVARAVEASGADALSLINTVAGMAIDLKRRSAVFQRGVAGLSGPAIKPVALYAIYRVAQAVEVPIIGMGGIACSTDIIEFLLAGATAVAVGTANFSDPLIAPRLLQGLEQWCAENAVSDISDLIGALQ